MICVPRFAVNAGESTAVLTVPLPFVSLHIYGMVVCVPCQYRETYVLGVGVFLLLGKRWSELAICCVIFLPFFVFAYLFVVVKEHKRVFFPPSSS